MEALLNMAGRIGRLEARLASLVRHGPVAEVNAAEGWVRLNLGEGDSGPLLSPKVPYAQVAGAMKVHSAPSVGQNMTMLSPAGDPRQAIALPMTWSDQNSSPSSDGGKHVLTFGDVRIEIAAGSVEVTVGGSGFVLDGSEMRMTTRLRAKGGSRAAHYVGGVDTDGDAAVDGNSEILI